MFKTKIVGLLMFVLLAVGVFSLPTVFSNDDLIAGAVANAQFGGGDTDGCGGCGDGGGGAGGDGPGGDGGEQPGCTDSRALNYNPEAERDDGSCKYDKPGCTDPVALNYNPLATKDDGSCTYPAPDPVCTLDADDLSLELGDDTLLRWTTNNADAVSIAPSIGTVSKNGNKTIAPNTTTTYTLTATQFGTAGSSSSDDGHTDSTANKTVTCSVTVGVFVVDDFPPQCVSFTADKVNLPFGGGEVKLSWATLHADSVSIDNGIGQVLANGTDFPVQVTTDTTYKLTASAEGHPSAVCPLTINVGDPVPDPITCADNVTFTADKTSLPAGGGNVVLTWVTTGLTGLSITDVTSTALSGTETVNVTDDKTFVMTIQGAGGPVDCPLPITVAEPNISCSANVSFTADRNVLPVGGGNVVLTWATTDVTSLAISGVTSTALSGTETVNVTDDKTFVMTIQGVGGPVDCPLPVVVEDEVIDALTCADVTFTSSDSLVNRGSDVTLSWTFSDKVTSASVSNGVGDVFNIANKVVTIDSDVTYNIVIDNATSEPVSCPLTIKVKSSGGGGGGSSSPRCDIEVSDKNIRSGEEITLKWNTTLATEMTIVDDRGNVIVTTEDLLGNDKDDLLDGEVKIRPTRDTTYTLNAERGSRDTDCEVKVSVGGVTVSETRDQAPRIAGISLTTVPYTGFEAGPTLTFIFYTLLTLWALFVAYVFVIKNDRIGGIALAGMHKVAPFTDASVDEVAYESKAEAYVHSVTAPTASAPANLPTAPEATDALIASESTEESADMTELENHAHAQKVLLSSDAMRFFISRCTYVTDRFAFLDRIIGEAKVSFPSEDGWVVLNLERMETICSKEVMADAVSGTVTVPAHKMVSVEDVKVPAGTGSLAEAILAGNIVAAYQMIESRPMIALADAAADLDNVYRARKGEAVAVSALLAEEALKLSDEQIGEAIDALTGAIDGTYSDEASAVKMAILKAVKSVS